MNPSLLTALVSLLVAAGGGIAWLVKRRDANRDPIPKHQAEVALAQSALGVIQASRDTLDADVRRLLIDREEDRSRIDKLEADRDTDRERIEQHRERISRLESLLGIAAGYIEALLRWVRNGSPPPQPPLPSPLHDLIDPSLQD